ncbi:MAG: hypothetical protein ACETWG_02050 [Candidatus Neomarinimicrobiota bacterium]
MHKPKKLAFITALSGVWIAVLLQSVGCDYLTDPFDPGLPLEEIEQRVRTIHDSRAVFTFQEYEMLLQELSRPRYTVLPLNIFRHTFDTSKVLVGMRHDVDCHPFKALEMAEMEEDYGIQATYYILHSADYYGGLQDSVFMRYQSMGTIYQQLFERAGEIGIHNDLIGMMALHDIEPLSFQSEEIDYYASLNIPIFGSSSHGGSIVKQLNLDNRYIYSDFHKYGTFTYNNKTYEYGRYSLADFGLKYEAYALEHNNYISDASATWNLGSLEAVIRYLQSCTAGRKVQLLTHPVWWGK